jgi:hypothetical protein
MADAARFPSRHDFLHPRRTGVVSLHQKRPLMLASGNHPAFRFEDHEVFCHFTESDMRVKFDAELMLLAH